MVSKKVSWMAINFLSHIILFLAELLSPEGMEELIIKMFDLQIL